MFQKSLTEEKFTSFVQSLEQRLFFIEQKNYMLEQKINALQGENKVLREHLERRITDFTDVWHPMMMDNINRIKTELVNEVEKVNSDFITEKINALEQKTDRDSDKHVCVLQHDKYSCILSRLAEKNRENEMINNPVNGNILIGYSPCAQPCYCLKTTKSNELLSILLFTRIDNNVVFDRYPYTFTLIFENLLLLDEKIFDVSWFFRGCKILLNNDLVLHGSDRRNDGLVNRAGYYIVELLKTNREVETIYKFCKNNGIEFLWNGKTHINNVPINSLF